MREQLQPGMRAGVLDGLGVGVRPPGRRAGAASRRACGAWRRSRRCELPLRPGGGWSEEAWALKKQILVLALILGSVLPPATYAKDQSELLSSAQPTIQNVAENHVRVAFEPFARTELFFGTDRGADPPVSDQDWQGFLDSVITPEFPDGLTVLTGLGQFKDSNGVTIQEKSFLLILLYPAQTWKSSSERIERIRDAYKTAFGQQSVLRVDDRRVVWVSF